MERWAVTVPRSRLIDFIDSVLARHGRVSDIMKWYGKWDKRKYYRLCVHVEKFDFKGAKWEAPYDLRFDSNLPASRFSEPASK